MNESSLHQQLDLLLKMRRNCQHEGSSGQAVQNFLRMSLLFIRDLMSEPVFERAMKRGDEGEGLLLLANRVQLLGPLMADNWPSDFGFDDVVNDLFGVANGDAPRIILSKGKQGKWNNGHAMLERRLDALGWYKVLGQLKVKAPVRQRLITESYGVTLEAFNKWRQEAKSKLTQDYVERYLFSFCASKLLDAKLSSDPVLWTTHQAEEGGALYRAEVRRSKN